LPALLPRLWRFAVVLSRDREFARDLVQEACLRALDRASQFQPGTRLDRWMFSILASIWQNELQRRRVRRGNGQLDAAEALVHNPLDLIEIRLAARQVIERVMQLPERQRATAVLIYVEGFTFQEAAETLNEPLGTVLSRMASVRRSVSRSLAPEMHGQAAEAEERP
jgi:RNA polymerase sigma-70 factor (ECF subfamily)